MNPTLIIGRFDDVHVGKASEYFRRRGKPCDVLTLGLPASHYAVRSTLDRAIIRVDDQAFDVDAYSNVLYLPFAVNLPPLINFDEGFDSFARREWDAALRSILQIWHQSNSGKWLIMPGADDLQNRKLYLLTQAARNGLSIPPMLLTNKFAEVEIDNLARQVVAKAINSWQEIRPGRYFNTALLAPSQRVLIGQTGRLEAPALLQEYIPHTVEQRLYQVGSTQLIVELQIRNGVVDSRVKDGVDSASIVHEVFRQESEARTLSRALGLRYVCYDFLVTEKAEVWLTDVNPTGSWAYLESEHGLDLTTPILDAWLSEGDS